MAQDTNTRPIIIKRRKKAAAHGHHGGAWKVAYADFVTAMMAFFLLMWLLNATSEAQRQGIADYFTPNIEITRKSGGGSGNFGGDSVMSEDVMAHNGTGASHRRPTSEDAARGDTGHDATAADDAAGDAEAAERFARVEEALMGLGGESMASDNALRHIVTRVTDEGLVIELFDLPDRPLFGRDGAPTETMTALAGIHAAGLIGRD